MPDDEKKHQAKGTHDPADRRRHTSARESGTEDTDDAVHDEFMGAPVPETPTIPDAVNSMATAYDRSLQYEEEVKPPKGAYIEDLTETVEEQIAQGPRRLAHPFADEFRGQGGRYVINPETGERQPVYERYITEDGEKKVRRAV